MFTEYHRAGPFIHNDFRRQVDIDIQSFDRGNILDDSASKCCRNRRPNESGIHRRRTPLAEHPIDRFRRSDCRRKIRLAQKHRNSFP